jgi:hypothetical protein
MCMITFLNKLCQLQNGETFESLYSRIEQCGVLMFMKRPAETQVPEMSPPM